MHPAIAHIGLTKPYIPFNWAATIGGWEWNGDANTTPGSSIWLDKVASRPVQGAGGLGAEPAIGINGLGCMRFIPNDQSDQGGGIGEIDVNGISNWSSVVVAEMKSADASTGAGWIDCAIHCDQSNSRWGMAIANFSGTYRLVAWVYDGSLKQAFCDIGTTVTGVRVYHMRRTGTSLIAGVNGVEGTPNTTIGTLPAAVGPIRFGSNANVSKFSLIDIYRACGIDNDGSLQTAAISAYVSEFS